MVSMQRTDCQSNEPSSDLAVENLAGWANPDRSLSPVHCHAKYKDRYLGAIGDIGTYSFHSTKNISTGEGGLLSLNNHSLSDRANVVFEKGTDRQAFINGEIDHYSWKDIGGSYEMSDYLKMILFSIGCITC